MLSVRWRKDGSGRVALHIGLRAVMVFIVPSSLQASLRSTGSRVSTWETRASARRLASLNGPIGEKRGWLVLIGTKRCPVSLVVLDEAHLAPRWGAVDVRVQPQASVAGCCSDAAGAGSVNPTNRECEPTVSPAHCRRRPPPSIVPSDVRFWGGWVEPCCDVGPAVRTCVNGARLG